MTKLIFRSLLTFFLIFYCSVIYAEKKYEKNLQQGDSLFYKKQYTQALEVYENLFQSNFYSPRMLIKMSLIEEGLGDYTYALYYLGIYYSEIPNRAVLKKMDEIASRYNLIGYEYNDLEFFLSLYNEYNSDIITSLLFVCALFLIYLYVKKSKGLLRDISIVLFISILISIFLLSNFKIFPVAAIIREDASLMSAPSAGSDVVGIIQKGNKIRILKEEDIWCKIHWGDKMSYVRKHHLLMIKKSENNSAFYIFDFLY